MLPSAPSPAISPLVNASRWLLTLACATTLALAPARAAVLIHEYALRGSLADRLGGPSLVSLGGQITALGYVFAANQGLVFASPTIATANYSLEFSFNLATVSGDRKLLDFQGLTSNLGLYVRNGLLDLVTGSSGGAQIITAGTDAHVVLTRNATSGLVNGYVNGQLSFSFTDTASVTVPGGANPAFRFFVDDLVTNQAEASGGRANYFRVFNGALTQADVGALFAGGPPQAVPEPSTYALLSVGGIVMAVTALRRRRRCARG